jgi:hypothetical protein
MKSLWVAEIDSQDSNQPAVSFQGEVRREDQSYRHWVSRIGSCILVVPGSSLSYSIRNRKMGPRDTFSILRPTVSNLLFVPLFQGKRGRLQPSSHRTYECPRRVSRIKIANVISIRSWDHLETFPGTLPTFLSLFRRNQTEGPRIKVLGVTFTQWLL